MKNARKKNILLGGGAMEKLDLSIVRTSRLFKPIVATSLVLALGVSVAVAQPTITTGDDTANQSSSLGITWTESNGAYAPQNSSDNSTITQLFLSFNNAETSEGVTENTSGSYAIKVSSAIRNLTLTSDKTLNLTGGSLEMRAGKYLTSAKDKIITLDLSEVTGDNYSLIGNLKAGGAGGNSNIATLGGKGIDGSVSVDGDAGINLTFTEDGAKITGGITLSAGGSTNTFTFADGGGSIGGNVNITSAKSSTFTNLSSIGRNLTISGGTNTFDFIGSTAQISGKVVNNGGTTTITNQNAFSIGGGIEKIGDRNQATLSITANSITINGKILSQNQRSAGNGINHITLDSGNNIVSNNTSDTSRVFEAIGSINRIIFNGVNSSVSGVIYSAASDYGTSSLNDITFNSTGNNTITGKIETRVGNNTITFANGNENKIKGKIIATGHTHPTSTNTIRFEGSGNATICSADENKNTVAIDAPLGSNIITFNNSGTQTITGIIQTSVNNWGGGSNTISSPARVADCWAQASVVLNGLGGSQVGPGGL